MRFAPAFLAALLAASPARAETTAMVVPIAKVPGVSDATAAAMGQEIAESLRRAGWEVDGPTAARERLPAGCLAADSTPGSPSGPGCACSAAQSAAPRRALVIAGRLSGVGDVTMSVAAYASATCAARADATVRGRALSLAEAQDLARRAGDALAAAMQGTLAVRATPAGAEIVVAGEPRGTDAAELQLVEGVYEVEARLGGHTTATATAEVRARERATVQLECLPLGPEGPEGPATAAPPLPSDRPAWQTPTALGALGLGAFLTGLTVANATQIGECVDDACRQQYSAGTSFYLLAGGAVVGLAAGAVLYFVDL